MPIDEYERGRPLGRRCRDKLKIEASDRVDMLQNEWQTSLSEIMSACFESSLVRKHRIKAIRTKRPTEVFEDVIKSAKKSLKRVFYCRCKKHDIDR